MWFEALRRLSVAALLAGGVAMPAHAISIVGSNSAAELAGALFRNVGGLSVSGAAFSSAAKGTGSALYQSGIYTNLPATFGLPAKGIVLSTGNVADFSTNGTGSGDTSFGVAASAAQNALLAPITGQTAHFDVSQLDIAFTSPVATTATVFATFGSMEFAEYLAEYTDGFGLFVNGSNVASVRPGSGGDEAVKVNINHPDMLPGRSATILESVLAPNGNPLLRFDIPVAAGDNTVSLIIADATDGNMDTTVYLSSLFISGPVPGPGFNEDDPVMPSAFDPETGIFTLEIPAVDADTIVWIDPPVSVGFEYEVLGGLAFSGISAPTLDAVNDPDGYLISVAGFDPVALLPGSDLDFLATFGVQPTLFTLTGIDPALMLDPADPLAFPLGVAFNDRGVGITVLMTPITAEFVGGGHEDVFDPVAPVPLPMSALLYVGGIAVASAVLRRRKAA